MGMEAHDQITVLDYTDEFALIYYCWTNKDNQYPSVAIYSSIPGAYLAPELEERFQNAIDKSGVAHLVPRLAEFCKPDFSRERCPAESF
jgi:hypothetical protein